MAKARTIIKRRKAVQNIRKITRTMQLIATARFQAAFNQATASKAYTQGITRLVEELAGDEADLEHPLLRVNEESRHSVLIVITSNRGLCGGYNAAVLRAALEHLDSRRAAGEQVDIFAVGKKGITYLKFLNYKLATELAVFEDRPQFSTVDPIAQTMMDAYERRAVDSVHVTYTRFESAARQHVETLKLLPLEPPTGRGEAVTGAPFSGYEYSPPRRELLAELLPETVRIRLFQCFLDAAVSEQVARMVAMKAATDAAGDMIRGLSQQYNRARQSQITLELLDIVGGAEALK